MFAFRDRALQTRIERIAGEHGDYLWVVGVLMRVSIMVDNGLES